MARERIATGPFYFQANRATALDDLTALEASVIRIKVPIACFFCRAFSTKYLYLPRDNKKLAQAG
jgi:hypothetical protein